MRELSFAFLLMTHKVTGTKLHFPSSFTNYGTGAASKDEDLILKLDYFALAVDGEAIYIDRTGKALVIKDWYQYYTFPFY